MVLSVGIWRVPDEFVTWLVGAMCLQFLVLSAPRCCSSQANAMFPDSVFDTIIVGLHFSVEITHYVMGLTSKPPARLPLNPSRYIVIHF